MATSEIEEVRARFEKVHGNAEGHPLFEQFKRDIRRRGKAAILADLDEAEIFKRRENR